MNIIVENKLKELYRKNIITTSNMNWFIFGIYWGIILITQVPMLKDTPIFSHTVDTIIMVLLGTLLLLDTFIHMGILWRRTISDDVYELGRSILTDPNWYLAYTYFYNKRWDDQDVETLVHKGQIIKINRGIEINSDPEYVKFTGTNVTFLTHSEKRFILDVIKARLLQDMVYKEAGNYYTTSKYINFLKIPYGVDYNT